MKLELKKCEASGQQILEALQLAGLVIGQSQTFADRAKTRLFSELSVDSRKVASGGIFLAYRGVHADGHQHIPGAIAAGAALLIVETIDLIPQGATVPWIHVRDGRSAWSFAAARLNDNPQDYLRFFGITGTNGKTSATWMLREILDREGISTLAIGTLGSFLSGNPIESTHTTPDPDRLFELFRIARESNIDTVIMEVSSHSLSQAKLLPLRFEGAGFTSFSRDHLDFHKDMDDYLAAKMILFSQLLALGATCAVAASIPRQEEIANIAGKDSLYGFADQDRAHTKISIIKQDDSFTYIKILDHNVTYEGKVPYFGSIAIENFVCACLLAKKRLGRFPDPKHWQTLKQVPGRLQKLDAAKNAPSIFVDYAHTPDALEKVLQVLRPEIAGRLIVVFGCGGNRDQGKRPIMGRVAESHSDTVIITSDNPRDEAPEAIIEQIRSGLLRPENATIEVDRRAAIELAIAMAKAGDGVLIAGKGHEPYQIIQGASLAFDDRQVAEEYLSHHYPI